MAPNQSPKKRGGRPRKHSTEIDAAQARKESKLRSYHRSRQQSRQVPGPPQIIFYEPLHPDIPADTPSSGLRVSSNIRIPLDAVEESDVPENLRPISPPPTQIPLGENNAKVAAQIKQIQEDEQESNLERSEYDAEILQRLNEIEAVSKLLVANTTNRVEVGEGESICEEGSQRSGFLQTVSIDEPNLPWGNNSITASNSPNGLASIQGSRENTVRSQTPTQRRSPSLQSSSKSKSQQGTTRQSTPFPSQKNNLLSWIKPLPQRLSVDTTNTTLPLATQRSPSSALPLPRGPSIIQSTPTPLIPNPTPTIPAIVARASPNATTLDVTASPAPTERTAFKLAKQLRNFQGCTHEQHRQADQQHQVHHQRPDVHSDCSSLAQITEVLRGNDQENPLPDVLSNPKLIKPMDFDGQKCRAAFEGSKLRATPAENVAQEDHLPKNLCLSQYNVTSPKNRTAEESYDFDSLCCFPTNLCVALQGINWFPKSHPILNLTADIHFGLHVPVYNQRGVLAQRYAPLHKIPHSCFGTVIGIETLLMFMFFPALYQDSNYEHSTYLSKEDQGLWYDTVISPALNKVIRSSNLMQHYPASARIVDLDSTAISAEGLARKESAREQLLRYPIQPQYLEPLWNLILETVAENPACHRFQGVTLFMHSKNTKLEFMDSSGSLNIAYENWESQWSKATDPQFYNKDRTFVDLAKQITSEDSHLPYDQIPEGHEAEVFLWKKCCLDAYSETRTILNADRSKAKGNPKRTTYPWATMRDTMGQTFFAAPHGTETQDGLIYSQFYNLIKTPFDTSKVYVFNNESLENLALDPGYIRSLQQEGGGITFSKAVCEFGYLHSKKRAHANLLDNRWKSYGIREEHRISLTMMEEISQQWRQWDLYDNEINVPAPLPYYIIPTQELLAFLYAQINKYCFLFEYVLAHTAMTYSLPETIVMVTALRALRFCYGGNMLQRESLLYKDRWENVRNQKLVVKEGLGMRDTIERCGLGWFLPKINWATWRFAPPHGENILVGNVIMHEEYKRRWRAVKDLRDVYVRFNQAESWYDRYNVQNSSCLLDKWLEYLYVLNLEQFDTDI
jgi:hypothetical protein